MMANEDLRVITKAKQLAKHTLQTLFGRYMKCKK